MMHKIWQALGTRDSMYKLFDMFEFDEGCLETQISKESRGTLKRGRGSKRQVNVAVMAESTPLVDIKTGKKTNHCRYFKLKVIE